MSKLEELIQQYCPKGVEYRTLGELGKFYGGITGKSKDDFKDGNAVFISYKNVYENPALDIHPLDKVKIGENEKQRQLEFGDILFTGSSETPDECGLSSVVTDEPIEPIYLNSFCFFLRLEKPLVILPDFAKHLFRSNNLRYQIGRTANGVTRFNVSKEKMAKVSIPVPPLPVQEEIVRILDSFTQLTAELQDKLQDELKTRKKQYEYYKGKLISEGKNIVKLREVACYAKGRICADKLDSATYVGVDNLLQNCAGKVDSSHVPQTGSLIEYLPNDILIGNIRPYLHKIWFADNRGGTNGDVLTIRINNDTIVEPRYLYYILSSDEFFLYDMNNAKGAKMPRGSKEAIMNYSFPLPPLDEQKRIADILDSFHHLVNDLSSGLPAEIEARQKQYEYYRDKLLSFKPLV